MPQKPQTFASLMHSLKNQYDLHVLLEDFLSSIILVMSRNPIARDYDLHTLFLKQRDKGTVILFMHLLEQVVNEMDRKDAQKDGNDVIGTFYESEFLKPAGKALISWEACRTAAWIPHHALGIRDLPGVRFFDPECRTGRMLVANALVNGRRNVFYGVESNPLCAKIAIFNLLMNRVPHAEILLIDGTKDSSFVESYRISQLCTHIHVIHEKEKSEVWTEYLDFVGKGK